MKELIKIEVKGKPKAWANNEWEWRKAIREECNKHPKIKEKMKLGVEIIFYLNNDEKPDLDNLAKPVLDTICTIRPCRTKDKTLTGNLFEHDDNNVFELVLSKQKRELEGATITIWRLD